MEQKTVFIYSTDGFRIAPLLRCFSGSEPIHLNSLISGCCTSIEKRESMWDRLSVAVNNLIRSRGMPVERHRRAFRQPVPRDCRVQDGIHQAVVFPAHRQRLQA